MVLWWGLAVCGFWLWLWWHLTIFGQKDTNTIWESITSYCYSWGLSFSFPVLDKLGCVENLSREGLIGGAEYLLLADSGKLHNIIFKIRLTIICETKGKETNICSLWNGNLLKNRKHAWNSRESKGLGQFHFPCKHDILSRNMLQRFPRVFSLRKVSCHAFKSFFNNVHCLHPIYRTVTVPANFSNYIFSLWL